MTTYRIVDWEKHFEKNRTRELKKMQWVPIPCKLDGDGYTELISEPDGPAIYGAWLACVIIAGRCDPRGTLVRDACGDASRPHDYTSLARISRIPAKVIARMLEVTQRIGWIEVINLAGRCENLAGKCDVTVQDSTEQEKTEQDINTLSFGANDGRDFIDDWNQFASEKGLRLVRKATPERIRKIRNRLASSSWLDDYREALGRLPIPGEGWQPDLDWFIRNDSNANLINEGKYDWRGQNGNGKSKGLVMKENWLEP